MPETRFCRFVKFVENKISIDVVQEGLIPGLGEVSIIHGEVNTKNGEFSTFLAGAG